MRPAGRAVARGRERYLSELADDLHREAQPGPMRRKHVFAYIYMPVPIQGASGSPGIPMAVR